MTWPALRLSRPICHGGIFDQSTQTKPNVDRTIRGFYIELPKSYRPDLKKDKRVKTYAHIYENYFRAGQSIYQGGSVGAH